jgi:sugar transferase (PEP-CTERM/EpsH1 system associated)
MKPIVNTLPQRERLHIVHVLHSLGVGGTENGALNLIRSLEPEFHHTVISMTAGGALADRLPAGVAINYMGKNPGLDPRTALRLTTTIRGLRPDIVHSRNWATFDAVLAARLAGVRIVIHGEHGRDIADPEGRIPRRRRLRRIFAPLVSRFVTVSRDLHRWLVADVHIPEGKVTTIHNGVDTARFVQGDRVAARAALGLPRDRLIIGTVGRLDPVKDQASLIQAFGSIISGHPEALLLIAGDGPCRNDLRSLVASLGIDGRVCLLGERADIPLVLRAMDVFVLPSVAEGISNTILEAMATGLPVVATRTGGNPELVEDQVTGTLVPVRKPPDLARALDMYLGNPDLRSRHGQAARQRAVEQFSLDRMTENYRNLYFALANGRSNSC